MNNLFSPRRVCHKPLRATMLFLLASIVGALGANRADAATFANFEDAQLVIGQADFTSSNTTNPAQNTTPKALDVAYSSQGAVAVASENGRVLLFNSLPTSNGANADVVVGKPNFFSLASGSSASLMSTCPGVAFSTDGNKLIVSDSTNNRILIWNSIPTQNGQAADVVIGQTDFTSNTGGTSTTKLSVPQDVTVSSDGKLLVTDYNNSRVLIYNSIPTSNGAAADVVIGQPDFTTHMVGGGGLNQLGYPHYTTVSPDGKLFVSDEITHSVRIWNSIPISNGASANVIIGSSGSSGTSATQFSTPLGVAVSSTGQLAIADTNNSRVLIYDSTPTQNGAAADVVLGQPDFTSQATNNGGRSAKSFSEPTGVEFVPDGRLMVADYETGRVTVFDTSLVPPHVESLSPVGVSDKVGNKRTFTLTMSDANGFRDIREMWLLINRQLDWTDGATLIYRPSASSPTDGQLFLRRGNDFLPPITIGTGASSSAVLDNGAVRVVGSDVNVSVANSSIILTLPLTIRDGLVGTNGLFARAQDSAGTVDPASLADDSGFVREGSYTVASQFSGATNSTPTLSKLNPGATTTKLNGSGIAPAAQNFGFFAKDEDGTGDIQEMWLLAGPARGWAHSATFIYYPRTRRLVLRSDDGNNFLGGGQIGSPGIIENNQVRVDLSKVKLTIYTDGKSLGLTLPLQAKSGLLGANKVWLRVQDNSGATAPNGDALGFVQSGTWNVGQSPSTQATDAPSNGNS